MKTYAQPKIHDDDHLQYVFNSNSNVHYCFRGVSHQRCLFVATDMAATKMDVNQKEGYGKWPVIDLAIVPHPEKPGLFIIEDRSEWTKG